MERRRIGNSDLEVSVVGLGCNNFGQRIDEARTRAVVDAALDAGINFFDTADSYGGGASEEFLGRALGGRRSEAVIATKFGKTASQSAAPRGGSRAYVTAAVDASLRRLGTDYIDLLQMHCPDDETPIAETLDVLDDLVRQGKVRAIGNSNFDPFQIADADWIAQGKTRFVSAQNLYSLLEQGASRTVLQACRRYGLGFLPFFPLASGLLSGKYVRGEPPAPGTRLAAHPEAAKRAMSDERFDRIEALGDYARAHGRGLLELAFAWLLGHPVIPSVIAGATSPEQVRANAAAAAWRVEPTDMEEVGRLARGAG
ncbi:aldo/keto reductase [Sphingomonas corticis]|uniref:Aldo/keto reductase n=1 Tax=Sphingomonas corticis TaxID=2722791 RepID=A0ABX1CUV8_9SPHN|nr:aldo/keto reductase [Sphingomonas corticis]NJR80080.1 aldo/keto reductase [Sphingomonas corticis]